MITFLAFLITLAGSIDWLLIGLLQYDFIAGFFGFQASLFSRMFYILYGVAAIYLVIRIIVNKGTFKIFERKKKKQAPTHSQPQTEYVVSNQNISQNNQNGLFDEVINSKDWKFVDIFFAKMYA